jgi:outer membrane lipoprotein-sorting protein
MVALIAVVLVAPTLAGCAVLESDADLPSGETVTEQLDSLDAIEGTQVTRMNGSAESDRIVTRVVRRLRTGEQRVVTESSTGGEFVTVSNGSTMWLYNRSADEVQVMDVEAESNTTSQFDSVRTIFERLNTRSGDESTPADISQLPVVPARGASDGTGSPATGSLSFYGNVSLTYNGTVTVAGRETFEVHITPRRNDSAISATTMWLDAEWYYPLKTRTVVSFDSERQTITTEFRNVTFNPEISSGTFEFDPPADATVVESDYESESYDSRSSLASATDIDVPDPTVPEGYAFESGSVTTYQGNRSVTVQYTNGSTTLFVSKRPVTGGQSAESDGETVDVAGQTGRISSVAGDRLLSWECGEWRYTVIGPLARERLVAVGESIDCG